MPSAALFRAFYGLRMSAAKQRSGCSSFRIVDGMAKRIIDMKILKKVEGYQLHWVYVNAKQFNPLLLPPVVLVKSSGWEHDKLYDERLAPLVERMQELRAALKLTTAMVTKEFLRRRIAPL